VTHNGLELFINRRIEMKRMTCLLLLVCLSSVKVLATQQSYEAIIYKGKERWLMEYPLEAYLEPLGQRPRVIRKWRNTGLYRGYIGTWEIKDDHLWFLSYECYGGWIFSKWKSGKMKALNKDWRAPVKATWYTGELCLPSGRYLAEMEDIYLEPRYERYRMIKIQKGKVVGERVIDNQTKLAEEDAIWNRPPMTVIGPEVKLKQVTVSEWETMEDIVDSYRVTEDALRKLNRLEMDAELEKGQVLKVPAYYQ
jgi:hypothetical protein